MIAPETTPPSYAMVSWPVMMFLCACFTGFGVLADMSWDNAKNGKFGLWDFFVLLAFFGFLASIIFGIYWLATLPMAEAAKLSR